MDPLVHELAIKWDCRGSVMSGTRLSSPALSPLVERACHRGAVGRGVVGKTRLLMLIVMTRGSGTGSLLMKAAEQKHMPQYQIRSCGESAVARRYSDVAGGIVHSDRSSQFLVRKVHWAITWHGLIGSMYQVSSAADNAAMESFFAIFQNNVLNRHSWATRDKLRIEIAIWIEHIYHRRRAGAPVPKDCLRCGIRCLCRTGAEHIAITITSNRQGHTSDGEQQPNRTTEGSKKYVYDDWTKAHQ